jgi:hypothetical protein
MIKRQPDLLQYQGPFRHVLDLVVTEIAAETCCVGMLTTRTSGCRLAVTSGLPPTPDMSPRRNNGRDVLTAEAAAHHWYRTTPLPA